MLTCTHVQQGVSEQGLLSPPTQYRLSGLVKRPNQQCQTIEGGQNYTQNTINKQTHTLTKNTENPLVYTNTTG